MSDDLLRNYTYEEPVEGGPRILLPPGEYPFRVVEVNDVEYSRATNNPYIPIKLEFDGPGGVSTCYENLVFTEKAKWKIDSFLKSIWGKADSGRRIDWTDAKFIGWLVGRTGVAKLRVAPVKGKDYERNEVESFLYDRDQSAAVKKEVPKPAPPPAVEEDDIPF
jgi:hypothetical protein